jgi:serine/threonine protein kinase
MDKVNEIIKFISKSDKKTIKNKLLDILEYNKFCPVVLGQGSFGKAYIPESKNMEVNIDNKKVNLPIVVKEANNSEDKPDINIDIIGNKLYIVGNYNGITAEAIILMYIKQLYSKTVHLPLLLGYGTCLEKTKINKIITIRHGLDKEIEVDISKNYKHKSYITTLKDLFNYIYFSKNKDGSVILPNGIKCDNISELYYYICISYLTTYHLLTENKIYPYDIHEGNIFIHWLNDTSYYNNENIKDCKNIIYKVKNKYYKIKTFGFLIIFGDTGCFFLEARKDVIIVGIGHVDK